MKNPAVDAYIAKAPAFAQPILASIRALFHRACPEIEETIKWGAPAFERGGLIGIMAAFKAHCRMILWRGSAAKIATLAELPQDAVARIKAILDARASGTLKPAAPRKARPAPKPPKPFLDALRRSPKALAAFRAFTPGRQNEYVDWIVEAKTPETRDRRIAEAVGWIAQGKTRYWKYGR